MVGTNGNKNMKLSRKKYFILCVGVQRIRIDKSYNAYLKLSSKKRLFFRCLY